ncbi:thiosulfate sulfurtransferase [Endozoicomonas montiporae]|uniref:Sulfurtransferase n=2 Tax=Endozoicomonas montiporae TaxID=1027273 RepID=A0A081MZF7_9GAMM|nr:rhodanese-like domain-containing protein [Endozoicomonas montiporae]AMO54737.1 thiosulfate sulfurtransferase [Endozoicomonas montiporae CL-33]KEQ11580.1 thiosulfate sulfurtransferase [Endozoicomonas montiporae]
MTQTTLPLVLEPTELESLLDDSNLLIIDLCNPQLYAQVHVPGAINVAPQHLVVGTPPATGKLPPQKQLENLFSLIGYTGNEHIVVYDDEGGGWAGRFIWTLDVIGHKRYSYLNGGIHAWLKEGHKTESEPRQVEPTPVALSIDPSVIASKDYILTHLENASTAIWDARSPAEYTGEKVLAMRAGHIPGAINFEWTAAMDPARNYRIRENLSDTLAELGITPEKDIITHCQTHHRSGFTYLVAKVLGFNSVRAYDGSWSEWGNLTDTPIAQ